MARSTKPIVLVFETGVSWVTDLESVLRKEGGYRPFRIAELSHAVPLLRSSSAKALVVCGTRLAPSDEIVLKEIRSALPAVIVVMFSDVSTSASLQGALDDGFTAVLPWPLDPASILRAVLPRPAASPQPRSQ